MRAYYFGNMYLSSIQQGIQALHVTHEMYTKYVYPDPAQQYFILDNWARDHKTVVLLNAGYGEEIRSLVHFFEDAANPLPWASFHEGKDSLDGALTCVGIVLPEEFYEGAKEVRSIPIDPAMISKTDDIPGAFNYNKLQPGWERSLAFRLNNYQLAK